MIWHYKLYFVSGFGDMLWEFLCRFETNVRRINCAIMHIVIEVHAIFYQRCSIGDNLGARNSFKTQQLHKRDIPAYRDVKPM